MSNPSCIAMKKFRTAILLVLSTFAAVHAADEETNKLTELTVEKARALAQTKGDLRLDGLAKISPEAAAALAEYKGRLFLNGLKELPLDVARALISHKAELSLDGLTEISEEVAVALGQPARGGNLHLQNLKSLPAGVAKGWHRTAGPCISAACPSFPMRRPRR